MDYSLPQRLQAYAETELQQAALALAMADAATDEEQRSVLLEIAQSGRKHAGNFLELYMAITGLTPASGDFFSSIDEPYRLALRRVLMEENRTFREYHRQFMSSDNMRFKEACYEAGKNKSENIKKLLKFIKYT